MAVISTSTTLTAELQRFDVPSTITGARDPFAVAEFIGTLVVPLKLAANQSLVTIILTWPLNYVFKIATINVHYLSALSADLFDLVDEITPGVIGQGFAQTNQNLVIFIESGDKITQFSNATGDNMVGGHPLGNYQIPIRTGLFAGDNTMTWQWWDGSADATNEITIFFRLRALMYTIEQFNSYPMFDAVPVIGV